MPSGATLRKTYLADSQKELVNLTAEVAKHNISEAGNGIIFVDSQAISMATSASYSGISVWIAAVFC